MHILIASPHFHEWRGNKITAERIKNGLESKDNKVTIVSSTDSAPVLPAKCDIIHGFHAYKFGLFREKFQLKAPFVITLTGTDINVNIEEPDKKNLIMKTLEEASIIHVFDEMMKQKVMSHLPQAGSKIQVLPQAVESEQLNLKKQQQPFIFFLPAGIRRVKNVTEAIEMLSLLADTYSLELWLAGPKLEEKEAEKVDRLVDKYPWLSYKGEVPYSSMKELYENADVVLNTSLSEGQSSAILEAMAASRPVLASDIAGNRGVIKHEISGLLYENPAHFAQLAAALMEDEGLRNSLASNAFRQIAEQNEPAKETENILKWYKAAQSNS